jgi:hypothetical protein
MDVDQQQDSKQQQQQEQTDKPEQQEQKQKQEQEPEQPTGPTLQFQALNTLQCLGMKAPKWLLPERAPGAAPKPICPITGSPAR